MAEPPPSSSKLDPEPTGFDTAAATDETRELQQTLAGLGFYEGPVDGTYGPATVEAVRRFQATLGLPADGIAGPRTLATLREAASAPIVDVPAANVTKQAPVDIDVRAERPTRPVAVILLRAAEDAGVVDELMDAIQDAAQSVRFAGSSASRLADVRDIDPRALVVPCVSEGFLRTAGSADAVAHARRGQSVMPLYLAPVDPATNTLADLPAFDGGTALSEWPSLEQWLPVLGREIALQAQLDPAGPRSFLPRFSADSLEGKDLLERQSKIDFLGSVLSAKNLETPLAIGLFGNWGSGKSFFMRRLQEQIVELTEASARAAKDGKETLYCTHIRHVPFNAWLHSGSADIWPAFAAEVFRGVAGLERDTPQGRTQRQALLQYQEQLRQEFSEAAEDQSRSKRIGELEQQVAEKRDALGRIEPPGGDAAKLVATVSEIARRLRHPRQLRLADALLVLTILLLILAGAVFQSLFAWILAGASALLAAVRYLDERRRVRNELERLESDLARERAVQAEQRRAAMEDERPQLRLVPEFAGEEAAAWALRTQLDAITQIRMKFEQLSNLIAEGIKRREDATDEAKDAVPIERVIVYVDDLDRCQHGVVVGVLETLKLLLSLPHFVVVVGVDSRWLFRSLQRHFRDLLDTGDGETGDADFAATPQNYLEKIFQYSVVLQPISVAGFASLIDDLLGPAPSETQASATLEQDGAPRVPTSAGATSGAQPAPADPSVSATHQPITAPPPGPDLTPAELVITQEEIAFMRGLAPLFETPRAAKRLVNVYRLLRVSVGAERLMADHGYQPALVLLGIAIGYPGLATDIFGVIDRSDDAWGEVVDHISTLDHPRSRDLALALHDATLPALRDRNAQEFAAWIRDVAEFSFHPWQRLLPAETSS